MPKVTSRAPVLSAALMTVLLLGGASSVQASSGYVQENLVANKQIFGAPNIDEHLINPWGIAIRPAGSGGHFWINNTDSGTVSLYVGDVDDKDLFQDDVKLITLPAPKHIKGHSAPTGQVFNGCDNEFVVTHDGITGPSKFIFATEEGTILGWTEKKNDDGSFVRPSHGVIMADMSRKGAIYKGLAISVGLPSNRLYAADFGRARIDVFDDNFKPIKLGKDAFKVSAKEIPANYAPFNIQEIGDGDAKTLFVTYAKLSKEKGEEEKGEGFGYVAEFNFDGQLIRVLEGRGLLNAPWGLALAPASFGPHGNQLLVGNFGDGRIIAFDVQTGRQVGALKNTKGVDVQIDGLWGMLFGNGQSLGEADHLYFAAGPNDEKDGVFGKLFFKSHED